MRRYTRKIAFFLSCAMLSAACAAEPEIIPFVSSAKSAAHPGPIASAMEISRLLETLTPRILKFDPNLSQLNFQEAVLVLGDKDGFCSGVAVSKTAVITAGHCVCDDIQDRVFLGSDYSLSGTTLKIDRSRTKNKLDCAHMTAPGKSYPPGDTRDVAILYLEESLPFDPRPIATESEEADALKKEPGILMVVGYGNTQDLIKYPARVKRAIRLNLLTLKCERTANEIGGQQNDSEAFGCQAGAEMTSSAAYDGGPCEGDSGGPNYVGPKNDPRLVAITSRLASFRRCGERSIQVRLGGDVYAWLKENIADLKTSATTGKSK
ncbi:trypsin-like serine protease [Herbaspirillum sp. RV1423]|uniref:trypsin-like serine protease n=1 Tax=Herbaspirillum sp. RV1423 TaxID=1443993 RepID=UPI0004BB4D72|nr:trypsin-like serine protease [Herbaspirillum sp. RV1423]